MPIHNFESGQEFCSPDGTTDFRSDVEKELSLLSVYNNANPDIAYAESLAREIINISGAIVHIHIRTDDMGNADEIWDEDNDPTYENSVQLKAYFQPEAPSIELTKYGIDSPTKVTIYFPRCVLLEIFGERMIRTGDLIEVPHNTLSPLQNADVGGIQNRIDRFRVLNSQDSSIYRYRWIYWKCVLESITGSDTIDVEKR
jgi:hypothetical protein